MCGIVGYIRLDPNQAQPLAPDTANAMLKTLWRRGPDGEGQWRSDDGLCWLGHRRLAVIDLHTGDQPMWNGDGTLWVVFNGEIYNFKELRTELQAIGFGFRTKSDTEVLLHGFKAWGGPKLVTKLRGIFAFALYDITKRALFLARDHMGVKPLYWWTDGKAFAFASEVKALLSHPGIARGKVNTAGVAQFLVSRYVSRPATMFRDIFRLPEASWMEILSGRGHAVPRPVTYWDVRYLPKSSLSLDDAVEQLDSVLMETVEAQLIADVPVGVQLSGGVDSSVVTAMMANIRRERGDAKPIKTFSVGFDVKGFSELPYARMVADRYRTDHHEVVVTFDQFARELPLLSWLYDEPLGEPPAIPTYFMCRRAKQDVTVMLCGEGADEQFGGYMKYVFEELSKFVNWLPDNFRDGMLRSAANFMPVQARRVRTILENLAVARRSPRLAAWYGALDSGTQHALLTDEFNAHAGDTFMHTFDTLLNNCDSSDSVEQFLYCDIHSRLVDHLLIKGDRMSMAAGIEARVPFLDTRVVEYAARLPRAHKVDGMATKIVLKKLAERYMPKELVYRRKVGFNLPLSNWFVGPLRGLVENVLLSEACLTRGYWKPDALRSLVNEHLDGKVDREQGIWVLLALEFWHRLFVDDDGSEKAVSRLTELVESSLEAPITLPTMAHAV